MASTAENIQGFLNRETFLPFRLNMTSGRSYDVLGPNAAALLKSEVFVVLPDGEHWAHVPFLHIASVETIRNGRGSRTSRRKRE